MDHLEQIGPAVFKVCEDGKDEPYLITGITSGTVSDGLLPGKINTLKILINNTGSVSILAPTTTFDGINDATTAFVNVSVEYELIGDVNCDGAVDLLDVVPFVEAISSGTFDIKSDANRDNTIDLLDVAPFIGFLTE
ncbi:MAG: hypothetical protein AAGA30_19695 [Planctomycetota bacterium]